MARDLNPAPVGSPPVWVSPAATSFLLRISLLPSRISCFLVLRAISWAPPRYSSRWPCPRRLRQGRLLPPRRPHPRRRREGPRRLGQGPRRAAHRSRSSSSAPTTRTSATSSSGRSACTTPCGTRPQGRLRVAERRRRLQQHLRRTCRTSTASTRTLVEHRRALGRRGLQLRVAGQAGAAAAAGPLAGRAGGRAGRARAPCGSTTPNSCGSARPSARSATSTTPRCSAAAASPRPTATGTTWARPLRGPAVAGGPDADPARRRPAYQMIAQQRQRLAGRLGEAPGASSPTRKRFTDSAGTAANAPSLGEALVATCIDFYGAVRVAEAPDGRSSTSARRARPPSRPTPSPSSRTPRTRQLAQRVRGLRDVAPAARRCGPCRVGETDGPVRSALGRQPIRKDVYADLRAARCSPASSTPTRPGRPCASKASARRSTSASCDDLVVAAAVDNADDLRAARDGHAPRADSAGRPRPPSSTACPTTCDTPEKMADLAARTSRTPTPRTRITTRLAGLLRRRSTGRIAAKRDRAAATRGRSREVRFDRRISMTNGHADERRSRIDTGRAAGPASMTLGDPAARWRCWCSCLVRSAWPSAARFQQGRAAGASTGSAGRSATTVLRGDLRQPLAAGLRDDGRQPGASPCRWRSCGPAAASAGQGVLGMLMLVPMILPPFVGALSMRHLLSQFGVAEPAAGADRHARLRRGAAARLAGQRLRGRGHPPGAAPVPDPLPQRLGRPGQRRPRLHAGRPQPGRRAAGRRSATSRCR